MKLRRHFHTKLVALIVTGVFVVVAALGGWLYLHSQAVSHDGDVKQVIGQVAKHVLLPSGETPAILTITDASKVQTQFLKQARNGDKVLVYQQAKKAIIYRPSIDRVIDIQPVVIDAPLTTQGQ